MKKLMIGLLSLLSLTVMAKEGGNGGGAFVCRDSKGTILSAELVDFYEGTTEYKLSIKKNDSEIEDQVNKAIVRYATDLPNKSADFISSVESIQKLINIVPNSRLENTNDFNLRIAPKSCANGTVKFEQLANYTDDNLLTVDQDIYSALSNTDKAGLIIHEAAYLISRQQDDAISSREARRLTGYLFSNVPSKSIPEKVLLMNLVDPDSNKKWVCSGLVVQAEYQLIRGPICKGATRIDETSPECYKKTKVTTQVITGFGSDLTKAEKSYDSLLSNRTLPYVYSKDRYVENLCGTDSAYQVVDLIDSYAWRHFTNEALITCQRARSVSFDCKRL